MTTLTAGEERLNAAIAGEHLRAIRTRLGLTRRQAARLSGFTAEAIQTWELGRNSPTLRNLSAYAAGLGLELAWDFRAAGRPRP